jgi:hypothetical protein
MVSTNRDYSLTTACAQARCSSTNSANIYLQRFIRAAGNPGNIKNSIVEP